MPAVQKDFAPSRREANLLLRKVGAYAKSSSAIPNIIAVAEAASKLKSAIKASEAGPSQQELGDQMERLAGELVQMLAKDAGYAAFTMKWDEDKKRAEAQSAKELKGKATKLHDFLVGYVTQNVTSDANEKLFPQIRALEELGLDPRFDRLETVVTAAEAAIRARTVRSRPPCLNTCHKRVWRLSS